MPAIITHHIFGEDIAPGLPAGLLAGEEELLAFLLGNQGPDPLFVRFSTLPAQAATCHRLASQIQGGSITHAVGADGTIYVGGYYGPEPVAISRAGEVLWQASTGSDIYWLYDIQVLPEGVLASYEMVSVTSDGLFAGAVLYDLETGETLEVIEE